MRTITKHGLKDRQAFVALTQHTNASTICNNTIGATKTCLLSAPLPCHFCQHSDGQFDPLFDTRNLRLDATRMRQGGTYHDACAYLVPRYCFRLSRTPRLEIESFTAPRLKVYPVRTFMDKLSRQGKLATGVNP
jgi:hypothetical protein